MCGAHYQRHIKGFQMDTPITERVRHNYSWDMPDLLERVLARTKRQPNGCLYFDRMPTPQGYSPVFVDGKNLTAHRLVMALTLGIPIEELVAVHHTCAQRRCINPDHLEHVTTAENNAEMIERNRYLKRIAQLEAALREIDPSHSLL